MCITYIYKRKLMLRYGFLYTKKFIIIGGIYYEKIILESKNLLFFVLSIFAIKLERSMKIRNIALSFEWSLVIELKIRNL